MQVQRHVAAQLLGVVAQNLQEVKLVNQSMKLADVPANSDTIGTRQKCHCRQAVLYCVTIAMHIYYKKCHLGPGKSVTVGKQAYTVSL